MCISILHVVRKKKATDCKQKHGKENDNKVNIVIGFESKGTMRLWFHDQQEGTKIIRERTVKKHVIAAVYGLFLCKF